MQWNYTLKAMASDDSGFVIERFTDATETMQYAYNLKAEGFKDIRVYVRTDKGLWELTPTSVSDSSE